MRIAQSLYEGVDLGNEGSVGLITYMRTDSTRISDVAISDVRSYVSGNYREDYLPSTPNAYKQKGRVQDAHEAIRPTSVERTPGKMRDFLSAEQMKIYALIWQRFVASQMTPALYDVTSVDIPQGRFLFRANGSVMRFDGFLAVYSASSEEQENGEDAGALPVIEEGESLAVRSLSPEQHFTKPPPRFTEASLIKELETDGIGRPSTYATIMSTLMNRTYVTVDKRKLIPTELGRLVSKICVGSFPEIFDVGFTRDMEARLDSIEQGEREWKEVIREFYGPFREALAQGDERSKELLLKESGQENAICDLCGRPMVVKWSRRGIFLGCSGFPECKNTKHLNGRAKKELKTDKTCPNCGSPMEVKEGRYGSFLACTKYPECKTTMALEEEPALRDEKCEKCGAPMVVKGGRFGRFLSCSRYPECKNTKPITLGIPCPKDGCTGELTERRTKRGKPFYGCSRYPDCDFAVWEKPVEAACPACSYGYAAVKRSRGRGGEKLLCLKCGSTIGEDA
jgi:DNA topoisomerase-1